MEKLSTDKNPANNVGFTPLHIAAKNGHFVICKLIIDHVDETNPADNNGSTPLYIAVQNGHLGTFKLTYQLLCKYVKKMFVINYLFS